VDFEGTSAICPADLAPGVWTRIHLLFSFERRIFTLMIQTAQETCELYLQSSGRALLVCPGETKGLAKKNSRG